MSLPVHPASQIELFLIIALLVLSWSSVILRLWVRIRITNTPGWDDALMVLTLWLFTIYCSFILVIIGHGAFGPLPTVKTIGVVLPYIQLGEVFYVLTTTTLKISLGLFFLRVLTKRWQKRLFYYIISVSAIYGVFYFLIAIFQCGRPDKLLDNLLSGKCLPTEFLLFTGYVYGTINVLADWTFVLTPIWILLESDMDRNSKLSVSVIMALGAVGSISSIMRMVYLRGLLLTGEYISETVNTTIWATAEPGTGIAAASLATLRPLFRQVIDGVRTTVHSHSSSRASRGKASSNGGQSHLGEFDNENLIALTSVEARGTRQTYPASTATDSRKASAHPMEPDTEDPCDADVTLEQGQIVRFINVRIVSEEVIPQKR
ncbi:hypothetical protein K469DRAFT_546264 [Zopfia rhizophila CBS 207.26]|uniref:Rhodopsin domain-containing protein n=1 Tax=Zopfia rhizophila CBS 207.26 TaxID=1314779 RepID=A0A6A6ET83_9PEZI|nr:hypothetical protein K469DRAFT_546264 [Zopfia rhizophila CBS 207.26]